MVDQTTPIGTHLDQAIADLDQVQANTPIVGWRGRAAPMTRRSATCSPLQDSYNKAGPLVEALPSLVGSDGPRTYLLAMLNPAEQRYSGGGALSFTTITSTEGRATFGTSVNVDDLLARGATQSWQPVTGNIFHKPGPTRVANATFSPWWSVSGEELLRGYQAAFPGQRWTA